MKICAIGDIHGRNIWEKIVLIENPMVDKWVFIGDYFDSRDGLTTLDQIENFKKILKFKEENPDKVVLLIGNHDFHYLKGCGETYSGYQQFAFIDINEVLQPAVNKGLLQMCYVYDEFIFSHAGLTNTWCEDNEIDLYRIEESVNLKLLTNIDAFKFEFGANLDRSGDDINQSPIWVRIPSLLKDMVVGFTYIVGHSTVRQMHMADNIIAIDCLGTSQEYLIIDNGEPLARKIISNGN